MIKAIFFDIDGTLVSFHTHRIPESTLEAVREVRRKGVKVFIATGRPLPLINNLDGLEYDGVVAVNGASVQLADGTVIANRPIARDDVRRMCDYQRTHPIAVAYASNDNAILTMGAHALPVSRHPDGYRRALLPRFLSAALGIVRKRLCTRWHDSSERSGEKKSGEPDGGWREVLRLLDLPVPPILPPGEALKMDVMQIIAFFPPDQEAHIMAHVLTGCATHRWHPAFTDCVAKGSDKAEGIDAIVRHLGIDISETMAFGDGGNDMRMLAHAGWGIAMGNARDEVKACARLVTDTVDGDGIANVLRHIEDFQ